MADQDQKALSSSQIAAMLGELRRQRDEANDRMVSMAAKAAEMTDVLKESQDTLTDLYNQVAALRAEVVTATANQPTTIEHEPEPHDDGR